jgi:hypothetical protein
MGQSTWITTYIDSTHTADNRALAKATHVLSSSRLHRRWDHQQSTLQTDTWTLHRPMPYSRLHTSIKDNSNCVTSFGGQICRACTDWEFRIRPPFI